MMLGESLLHKGLNWNLFDVGLYPGPIRLVFAVNCISAGEGPTMVWYLRYRGTCPGPGRISMYFVVVVGVGMWSVGTEKTIAHLYLFLINFTTP